MTSLFLSETDLDGIIDFMTEAQKDVLDCCKITKHFNSRSDLEWDSVVVDQLKDKGLVKLKPEVVQREVRGFNKWYSTSGVTYACLTPKGAQVLQRIRELDEYTQADLNRALDGGYDG